MRKSLIRKTSNTKPFNRFELGVLEFIHEILDGTYYGLDKLVKSNIKGTFALTGPELMYFYALYKKNKKSGFGDDALGNEVDFSKLKTVKIPKMYDYNVNYLQDVSAWRSTDHNVIATDEEDAYEAMDIDFGNYYGDTEVTTYIDDYIETGDAHEIFDSQITNNLEKSINETRNIIKNILKEYKK